jgi:hypothetical protein
MPKKLEERIAAAKARKEKAAARLNALETKAKLKARKDETRRKIVVGAAVLSFLRDQPEFGDYLAAMLARYVSRAHDREAVADLLTPSPAPVATEA